MKLSAYGYIFNATIRDFNIEDAVENFCSFFDEVVLATIKSEDDTKDRLSKLEKKYQNLKIVESDITTDDNRFDGKLKTVALQKCTNPIRVILDCDEKFLLSQKEIWHKCAEELIQRNDCDGFMIPVIDLWGNEKSIRANHPIGQKFRMHKDTIVRRGVIPQAELGNGRFLTSLSDSTEPLREDGNMGKFVSIVDVNFDLHPLFCSGLIRYPYVLHYGTIDFERRAKIGREFWAEKWSDRSGQTENVVTDKMSLEKEITIEHGLPIE